MEETMNEYHLSETARQDHELLLIILIPITIVVLFIIILEGQNELCNSIAITSWVLVLWYSFFVSLYGLYLSFNN